MFWIHLGIGFGLGALLTGGLMYIHLNTASKVLHVQLDQGQQAVVAQKADVAQAQAKILELTAHLSRLTATNYNLEEKLADQKQTLVQTEERLATQFKNLANDLLEEKSKKFTDQNKTQLESLLKPLGERIQTFERQVVETNKEELARSVALRTEIKKLHDLNAQITQEAANLTRAIKGDTKMQGNWGEFILESILEKSGLVRDREYSVQASWVAPDGKRYQPDVIIKLPNEKHLIIDAKISLVNYEQFFSTENEEESASQLKKHLQSVRKHIKTLSEKNYQMQYNLSGLDFVLMFIAVEPAFSLALQHDPTLFNEAYEKNIIIVSPTTLLATLRTIDNLWKHEYQNQNALQIAHQSGKLYDKFVKFVEDLQQVGKHIDHTQRVYADAMKTLSDGRDNLISKAQKIQMLGARTSKTMPPQLLQRADAHALDTIPT